MLLRPAPGRALYLQMGKILRLAAGIVASAASMAAAIAGAQSLNQLTGVDTGNTPRPKQAEDLWHWAGGVRFGKDVVRDDSPTPIEADLFTVRFAGKRRGLAGGSICTSGAPSDGAAVAGHLRDCPRVPVIYRYDEDKAGNGMWTESYRGTSEEGPGYVGAVAWIDKDRAIAVGGTGVYPRREPDATPGSAAYEDPAGTARAWMYADGHWRELTHDDPRLSAGLGGMTALGCSPRDPGRCIAGGLAELTTLDGSGVMEVVNRSSPPEKLDHPYALRFRVRDIRFTDSTFDGVEALAVTDGCCSDDATVAEKSSLLSLEAGAWHVISEPGTAQTYASVNAVLAGTGADLRPAEHTVDEAASNARPNLPAAGFFGLPDAPDSYYGLLIRTKPEQCFGPGRETAFVSAPAAEGASGGSYVGFASTCGSSWAPTATDYLRLGDARLVSIGGVDATKLPDWAVGSQISTGQGLAIGLNLPDSHPDGEGVSAGNPMAGEAPEANPQKAVASYAAYDQVAIDSHALNAIDVVSGGGTGWAVGDRGALWKYEESGSAAAKVEPPPAELGGVQDATRPDGSPYDPFRPPASRPASPGAVPALAMRPLGATQDVPFAWAGSGPTPGGSWTLGDDRFVLSRDGSEGWAFPDPQNSDPFKLTAYHFMGDRWAVCDPVGTPSTRQPPDRSCAALAYLQQRRVRILAVARVPLERDDDPLNDDEFEAVALRGGGYGTRPPGSQEPNVMHLLRYRDGRWQDDRDPSLPVIEDANGGPPLIADIAFTAPDDGWILARGNAGGLHFATELYHYDGKRWAQCVAMTGAINEATRGECGLGAGNGFAAKTGDGARLAVVGPRLYLYGARRTENSTLSGVPIAGSYASAGQAPLILYRDPGGPWTAERGGLDPARKDEGILDEQGSVVTSLAVAPDLDGGYVGWALLTTRGNTAAATPAGALLRLGDDGEWRPVDDPLLAQYYQGGGPGRLVALSGTKPGVAMLTPNGRLLRLDGASERLEVLPRPFKVGLNSGWEGTDAYPRTIAPDGRGGFFLEIEPLPLSDVPFHTAFYRYAPRSALPVFDDAPQPLSGRLVALAGGGEDVWLADDVGRLARLDPLTGWETLSIPGWDPGRLVTSPTPVSALAVGPDGRGLAVGPGGRIAEIDPAHARLDAAVRTSCAAVGNRPPCGTGRDLVSAAVAPDGSAMIGGRSLALLWRPGGGGFQAVAKPEASLTATVEGVSMPSPDRAWIVLSTGQIFAGVLTAASWSWTREDEIEDGASLSTHRALRAIAIGPDGDGYAVGDDGLVLRRDGDGAQPWRPLEIGLAEDLTAVAAGPGGGAWLIGGEDGLILTEVDGRLAIARGADELQAASGPVAGLAIMSGPDGGLAAYAALDDYLASHAEPPPPGEPATSTLLRYVSDSADPWLVPSRRVRPLPDAPAPRAGELTLAAFGKSGCMGSEPCWELTGTNAVHEVVTREIVDDLSRLVTTPWGPELALYTGEVNDNPGRGGSLCGQTCSKVSYPLERWDDFVVEPLAKAGLPVFGAVGRSDTSGDDPTTSLDPPRTNSRWRSAMADQPVPWGTGPEAFSARGLTFVPVSDRDTAQAVDAPAGSTDAPAGGARTHYAVDVVRSERKIARLLVVDTSQESLTASDPGQHPLEPRGGQLDWLQDMLCVAGTAAGTGRVCTREAGQQAIVLSSTPSYSYGPSGTQSDAATFESVLLAHRASLVVSGHLGWNGRYWAFAPGVHYPCPGDTAAGDGDLPAEPQACGQETGVDPTEEAGGAIRRLTGALGSLAAPPPPGALPVGELTSGQGVLPFIVASGAGGEFAQAKGAPDDGYWHGYSIVRLAEDGDPRKTIVEQRALFDWLVMTAPTHVLRPGQKMTVRGMGREPFGTFGNPGRQHLHRIATPSITHRYDLLLADPERPWLPKIDPANDETTNPHHYVRVPPDVASIDSQTGRVVAARASHGRVYALAVLSVGGQAASYPLVFEPRRSFVAKRVGIVDPPAVPPVRTLGFGAQSLTPPAGVPPAAPPASLAVHLELPAPPAIPYLPLGAPQPVVPPVPPAPPPPPAAQHAAGLSVAATAVGVAVPPPGGVTAQPTPPVQPAPPAGARREAKQRQAATAKSEESASHSEAAESDGDLAQHPPGVHGMTRHDRVRAEASGFSAVPRRAQPSAWVTGLEWSGLTGLTALVFALGWFTVRPGSRGRRRDFADPAVSWLRERR